MYSYLNAFDPITQFQVCSIADLKQSWFLGTRLPTRKEVKSFFSNLQFYYLIKYSNWWKLMAINTAITPI
jgi:hypothetical protein